MHLILLETDQHMNKRWYPLQSSWSAFTSIRSLLPQGLIVSPESASAAASKAHLAVEFVALLPPNCMPLARSFPMLFDGVDAEGLNSGLELLFTPRAEVGRSGEGALMVLCISDAANYKRNNVLKALK
jgi:hypothetical protein